MEKDKNKVAKQREFKMKRNVKKKNNPKKSKKKITMDENTTPMHVVCVDLTEESESEVYINATKKYKAPRHLRKSTSTAEKENTITCRQIKKSKAENIVNGKIIQKLSKEEEKDETIIVNSSSSSQEKYPKLIWKSEKEENNKAKKIRLILTNLEDDIIKTEEGDVEKIRLSEILRNTQVEDEITTSGLSENTNDDEEMEVPLPFSFMEEEKQTSTTCAIKVKDDWSMRIPDSDYLGPDDTRIINYKHRENKNIIDKNYGLHYMPTKSSEIVETSGKTVREKNKSYIGVKDQQNKDMKNSKDTNKIKQSDDEYKKKGIEIGKAVNKSSIKRNIAQHDEEKSKENIKVVKNAKKGEESYDMLSVLQRTKVTPKVRCFSVFNKTSNTDDSSSESVQSLKNTDFDKEKDDVKYEKGEGSQEFKHSGIKRLLLKDEVVTYNRIPQIEEEEQICTGQNDKKAAEMKGDWGSSIVDMLDYEEGQNEQTGFMEDETILSRFPDDEHYIPQKEDLLLPSKFNAKVIALDTPSGLFMETNMEEDPESSVLIKKENLKIHINLYKKKNKKAKILNMFPNLKKYCSPSNNMKVTFNVKANLSRLYTKMFWCRCTCKISRLFNLVTKKSRSLAGLVFYVKCRRHAILQPLCRLAHQYPEE